LSRIIKCNCAAVHENPYIVVVPQCHPKVEKKLEKAITIQPDPAILKTKLAAKECLEQARQEADTITQSASEEAANIISQAKSQAEELQKTAQEEGFSQGHNQGMAEGLAQGRAQGESEAKQNMQQAVDEAVANAQSIVELAEQEAQNILAQADQQILELAIAIAGKILNQEIAENQMAVVPIIKAALDKVRDQERVVVRVNPENYSLVLAAKAEFSTSMNGYAVIDITADDSLKAGDCIVETPFGNVDARIDNQFEILKTVLRDIAS